MVSTRTWPPVYDFARAALRAQSAMHKQRDRNLLAGGEQHVHLARFGLLAEAARKVDESIGAVAHRGDDDGEVGAAAPHGAHLVGDAADQVE